MGKRIVILSAVMVVALPGLVACGGAPSSAVTAGGVEKTFFVAPLRKPCTGVGPMECLQVRESPDRPWQFFYSEIEGFSHEPGHDYELLVLEEKVASPPADGSSLRWRLLKVVSKRPSQAEGPQSAPQ